MNWSTHTRKKKRVAKAVSRLNRVVAKSDKKLKQIASQKRKFQMECACPEEKPRTGPQLDLPISPILPALLLWPAAEPVEPQATPQTCSASTDPQPSLQDDVSVDDAVM